MPKNHLKCIIKAKAKVYNIYIAPQASCRSCSGASMTDRPGVQPIGRRLS